METIQIFRRIDIYTEGAEGHTTEGKQVDIGLPENHHAVLDDNYVIFHVESGISIACGTSGQHAIEIAKSRISSCNLAFLEKMLVEGIERFQNYKRTLWFMAEEITYRK